MSFVFPGGDQMNVARLFRFLSNDRGFSLLELLLSITIAGLIFGVAAETMIRQADTYAFVSNRKATIADIRHTVNQITYEFLRLETSDIIDISDSNIDFIDHNGDSTDFHLDTGAAAGTLSLYRGSNEVLKNVSSFELEYQDETGAILDAIEEEISNVRRVKVTITTEAVGEEGNISLSTMITPRSFIGYNNFQ